jgi:hypothetical protein
MSRYQRNDMSRVWFVLTLIFFLVFAGWAGTRAVQSIFLKRDMTGHLKLAADANTIALAKRELGIAVKYLEENSYKSGYTSIVFNTPDEDIGFWYENLSSALRELESAPADVGRLEASNTLIKLRETLLDASKDGSSVTVPDGFSIYPHNLAFALWGWLSVMMMAIFGFLWLHDE